MIGQLKGMIIEKTPPELLILVQGVGYEVNAPMSTFYRLPDIQQEVLLFTHFIVREDAQQLYGFYTKEERTLFRILLKVNGVGPRLALTILSSMEPPEFVRCVNAHDKEALVRLPGIGAKTAERLIIEMRDKVAHWQDHPSTNTLENIKKEPGNQRIQDAISALISLGYKPQEASRAVSKVETAEMSSEEIIRFALREKVT
jgi:Holliday junction DNA helicase RuvA